MRPLKTARDIFGASILFLALMTCSCQQEATVTNTNTTNTNDTTTVANTNGSPTPTATVSSIETREPDRYRATLVITAQSTGGERSAAVPPISLEVARDGANRRFSTKVPMYGQIVLLDRPDKRYIIMPDRKQYFELTAETTGFDVQRLMTPGQVVGQLEKQGRFERVGEEEWNGRPAIKYRYASTTHTPTQAGDVNAETYLYIDKETGLPLHTETVGEATNSIQGVKSGKIVTEMKDIQTDVDPKLFDVPQNMTKLTPEQVRQQAALLLAISQAFLNNMSAQSGGGSQTTSTTTSTTTATTTASPSPSATVKPGP